MGGSWKTQVSTLQHKCPKFIDGSMSTGLPETLCMESVRGHTDFLQGAHFQRSDRQHFLIGLVRISRWQQEEVILSTSI